MSFSSTPEQPSSSSDELAAPLAEKIREAPRLQYLHSYTYAFEGGDAFLNLALISVCMLIPIVGPIVLGGYQYEIVAALHRWPKQTHPEFEFSRFGDYLSRGIWKFLADMIMWMIATPVYLVVFYGGMFAIFGIGMLFGGNQPGGDPSLAIGIAATIVVPLALFVLLALMVGLRLVINPLVLKASLSGEAADLFDISFMTDFVRRTWRESLLELTWMFVTYPIVILVGYMLCLIGVLPAAALWMMADAHTNWQLYEIYLARGGRPIRLKSDKPGPVVPAPAVS